MENRRRSRIRILISILFTFIVFLAYGSDLYFNRHIALADIFIHLGRITAFIGVASIFSIILAMVVILLNKIFRKDK